MFCVNCGKQLEEQWKVCPKCGTEVVKEKEETIIEEQRERVCQKCGNSLEAEWIKCPFCGNDDGELLGVKKGVKKEMDQNLECRKFEFEGFRRTGRFGFKYLQSSIGVNGNEIQVVKHKKKDEEIIFTKDEIADIKYPIEPVLGGMDIFRIILFLVLMFLTKGLSIFAVLFFYKITLVRHMQIRLHDGLKVEIPIRQKAETVEFLKYIDYPENEVQKIAATAVSDRKIAIREWIVSTLMLILAAATIVIGMETYISDRDADNTNSIEQDDTVRTMEEVGGYEAWVESEYASKVRTDIVVMLPVTQREADTYAVNICTSLGDVIYIKQKNGALATEWDWLINAVPDIEGGDTATFQATLTIDGYAISDGEKPVPIFIAEDIEGYTVEGEEITEEEMASSDNKWKNAYRAFVEENGKEDSTYSLIYVNDDDIPELVIAYGSTADGMDICTYDGERVRAKGIALSSILYLFKENVIFASSGHMDNYEDTFLEIRNGEFVEIAKGKYGAEDNANIQLDMYGDPIYQYYWNGVEVSQQEYENELANRGIEESSSFDPPAEMEYYDIMQILLSSINTTIIREYIHEAGYYGMANGYCIYFDGIEDESLQLRIVKDDILIASGSVPIVDENTAEYHLGDDHLVFKFGNSDYFELTGNFDGSTLTDTYHGMWG